MEEGADMGPSTKQEQSTMSLEGTQPVDSSVPTTAPLPEPASPVPQGNYNHSSQNACERLRAFREPFNEDCNPSEKSQERHAHG